MPTPLYRITSFESFMSLLVNQQERYVRPIDCWEDTYEGYLLHLLDSDAGESDIIHRLYTIVFNHDIDSTVINFVHLQHARYACYGQCWSRSKDSDAMWRIYSPGRKGIQLVSDRPKLEHVIGSQFKPSQFRLANVKYDIMADEDAKDILHQGVKYTEPFFHKRTAFEHEKETRIILHITDYSNAFTYMTVNMFRQNYKYVSKDLPEEERIIETYNRIYQGKAYPHTLEREFYVSIPDMKEYLTGIRVHPQAEKWFVDLVEKICVRFSIPFLGQSDLYRKCV